MDDQISEQSKPNDRPASSSWPRRLGRLALELVIVFIGVYAAFALNSYRERQRDDARRLAILEALQTFNRQFGPEVRRADSLLTLQLDALEQRIADGERPRLQPLEFYGGFSAGMWESMLSAGGLDVLSPELILAAEAFNTQMRGLADLMDRVEARNTHLLIPRLDEPPEAFYDPETGRLLPQHRWVLSSRRNLLFVTGRVIDIQTRLDSLVQADIEALE